MRWSLFSKNSDGSKRFANLWGRCGRLQKATTVSLGAELVKTEKPCSAVLQSKKNATWKVPALSALSVFVFFVSWNFCIPVMRSLPDEIGAVSLAAELAGYNWNHVLTNPRLYYGFGGTPLFYPFFVFVKEPYILYQCLLACVAFMKAVPAFLAANLLYSKKYFDCKNPVIAYLGGIVCAIITGTRATNVDNEALLSLCCWGIFYLLVVLIQAENRSKQQLWCSIALSAVCCFSLTVHTRAILYTLCILVVIGTAFVLAKKTIVRISAFAFSYATLYLVFNLCIKWVQNTIYDSANTTQPLQNSADGLAVSVQNGLTLLFKEYGVQSFFDMLFGNIWAIFIGSGGMLVAAVWVLLVILYKTVMLRVRQGPITQISTLYAGLFCLLGLAFSVGGVCLNWLWNGTAVHMGFDTLSRGHFYLRYSGNFWGPLLLVLLVVLIKKNSFIKPVFRISIITVFLSCGYSVISYVALAYKNFPGISGDWFYLFAPFAPFLGIGTSWPNLKTPVSYFLVSTLVVAIIFSVVFFFFYKKKAQTAFLLLTLFAIYQYGYGVLFWDRPFAQSAQYEQSSNATMLLREQVPEVFEEVEKIHARFSVNGPQYILQFGLKDIPVIVGWPEVPEKDLVIFSDTKWLPWGFSVDEFKTVQLDDNEFLTMNDEKKIHVMEEKGFVFSQNPVLAFNGTDLNYNEFVQVEMQSNETSGNLVLTKGGIQYGPYIEVKKGQYEIVITGENLQRLRVELYSGNTRYERQDVSKTSRVYRFSVSVEEDASAFEIASHFLGKSGSALIETIEIYTKAPQPHITPVRPFV